jgi:hypothetical protein
MRESGLLVPARCRNEEARHPLDQRHHSRWTSTVIQALRIRTVNNISRVSSIVAVLKSVKSHRYAMTDVVCIRVLVSVFILFSVSISVS